MTGKSKGRNRRSPNKILEDIDAALKNIGRSVTVYNGSDVDDETAKIIRVVAGKARVSISVAEDALSFKSMPTELGTQVSVAVIGLPAAARA